MFVYSTNGADGWDELESIKESILELDGPGQYTIYRGETHNPNIANFIHADYLIEPVSDCLFSEYGEYCESFIDRIEVDTEELRKDLIDAFKRHIERRGAKLDFYTVHSIEEVRVIVEEE
ncbi:hypothetical protein [Sinomicrobium sp.]